MKVLILLLSVLALSQGLLELEFGKWMSTHNKVYSTYEEYKNRLAVFSDNYAKIEKLNLESTSAVFSINKFADLSSAEFKALYLGYEPSSTPVNRETLRLPRIAAPDTFDWISKGKVTPVKDQKQCGSCWAFSATENIESVWMIAKGLTPDNFEPLAPQQIVDCDTNDGGCNGGDTVTAYQYVISAGGQDTEKSYPYKAVNQDCKFKSSDIESTISSFKYATKDKNEDEMKTATATVSPLSICVDAEPWQFYTGGILKASQCSTSLDHCVQITGYDTSAATPYWEVRNSWGTDWGEKGFIRLEYGKNTCGLAIEATTAVV
jgi:C1A family cysteine protease